jgi:hypothetical protein
MSLVIPSEQRCSQTKCHLLARAFPKRHPTLLLGQQALHYAKPLKPKDWQSRIQVKNPDNKQPNHAHAFGEPAPTLVVAW